MVSFKFEALWPVVLTQIIALLIAGTAVSSEMLATKYDIVCPTFQTVGCYVCLLVVYIPWYIVYGYQSVESLLKETWWKYALLALVDFEANYTIVMAYKYTSITSVQVCPNKTSYNQCIQAMHTITAYKPGIVPLRTKWHINIAYKIASIKIICIDIGLFNRYICYVVIIFYPATAIYPTALFLRWYRFSWHRTNDLFRYPQFWV